MTPSDTTIYWEGRTAAGRKRSRTAANGPIWLAGYDAAVKRIDWEYDPAYPGEARAQGFNAGLAGQPCASPYDSGVDRAAWLQGHQDGVMHVAGEREPYQQELSV